MKKIVLMILVCVLLLASFIEVVAEEIPSKTVANMTFINNSTTGVIFRIDTTEETVLDEVNKLKRNGVNEYFGEEVMTKVHALLKKDQIVIVEHAALFVENYDLLMGDVVADITVPYKAGEGEQIVILISLKNGMSNYVWKEYLGIGDKDGSVIIQLDSNLLSAIQKNTGWIVLMK